MASLPRPQRQRPDGPLRGPAARPSRHGSTTCSGGCPCEEKVGLMFQTVIEAGADGTRRSRRPGAISKSPTSVVVLDKHLTHFNVHALERRPDGGPLAQRPPGARRADAARHTRDDLDRPAPRVHRERRGLVHGRGVLAVAGAARAWRRCATRTRCASSPTSPGRSTSPSASGPRCTRPSTSRPSRAGRARPARSARTPTS